MTDVPFLVPIDMGSQQIHSLADGSADSDAINWGQVKALVNGAMWREEVVAAGTANVNIASPGASLDGVSLIVNQRILLKNQTDASQNGVWVFDTATTALIRPAGTDIDGFPHGGLAFAGWAFYVNEGTVNANTAWVISFTGTGEYLIDTDDIPFVQFGGGGASYTAGNGIDISGSTISAKIQANKGLALAAGGLAAVAGDGIEVDSSGIHVEADTGITVSGTGVAVTHPAAPFVTSIGDGSTTDIEVTHSLGTRDVLVQVYRVSDYVQVQCGITRTDANNVTFSFAVAPTSNQYRVVIVAVS